ncbi:hypothetical protein [Paraburkholderia dinghuensis]|nr:hypothetical protein [Paraburkholderia dinghuensis]
MSDTFLSADEMAELTGIRQGRHGKTGKKLRITDARLLNESR